MHGHTGIRNTRVFQGFRPPEASRPKSAINKKRSELNQCEVVGREHKQRIGEQFAGASTEVIEPPVPLQNLGNFRNSDKVRRFRFERIQSHRHDGVGRVDDNELPTQVTVLAPFAGIDF